MFKKCSLKWCVNVFTVKHCHNQALSDKSHCFLSVWNEFTKVQNKLKDTSLKRLLKIISIKFIIYNTLVLLCA